MTPTSTVPTLAGQPIRITSHAIDRFQERVSRGASRQDAFGAIRQLMQYGIVRNSPRAWTTTRHEPDCRYVYSDLEPDICLIVDGDAVVTILTRELCQPVRLRILPRPSGTRTRQVTYSRRWDAESAWEAYEALPAELAQIA